MIGCEGKRRPLFAALSANVEAAETTMKSAHTHTCSGVRLDVRELEQVQRSCIETRSADVNTGLPQILPMTISSTANTSLRSDYTEGGTPAATLDVDFTTPKLATAEKFTLTSSVETAQDSCNASGNSKSSQIEISQSTKVDKQTEIKAKEGVGAVQNDADTGENMVDLRVAPTSTSSHEFSGNWSNAAGTHPKNYRLGRAVLCEDLTHAEVGALVTPECWRDPFQVRYAYCSSPQDCVSFLRYGTWQPGRPLSLEDLLFIVKNSIQRVVMTKEMATCRCLTRLGNI